METTERETFQVKGTREKPETIEASEVLNAIAEDKNIDVEYAVIKGDLDIDSIADLLKQDKKGKLIIQGNVLIQARLKGMQGLRKPLSAGMQTSWQPLSVGMQALRKPLSVGRQTSA